MTSPRISILHKTIVICVALASSTIALANTFPTSGASTHASSDSPTTPLTQAEAITCGGQFLHKAPKDMIWSSVATLVLCALVAVRPNMGNREEGSWRETLRQIGQAFCVILAPEMMIFWALKQWKGAKQIQNEFKAQGWTMSHGHFMQMGGFTLFDGEQNKGVLDPDQFKDLLLAGRIAFPTTTANEIKDRNKDNFPIKLFAFFQVVWTVAQTFSRVWHGFALTGLELLTLVEILSCVVMFTLWWDKPRGFRMSVPVQLLYHSSNSEQKRIGSEKVDLADVHLTLPSNQVKANSASAPIKPGYMRVPTFHYAHFTEPSDAAELSPRLRTLSGIAVTLCGAIYSLSCLPGTLNFPTYAEATLWRASSAITITVICALFLEISGRKSFHPGKSGFLRNAVDVYLIARLVLLTVALAAFRALPPTANIVVKWTSYIRHV